MKLSLGTSALAQFSNMFHLEETGAFLRGAAEMGFLHVDTAPLYSSLDSERLIGRFLPQEQFEKVSVSSKFGIGYSNAPFPVNRILQRADFRQEINLKIEFSKQSPRLELKKSLVRLKRSSLETFFFHRMPSEAQFYNLLDEVKELKSSGLVQNIGLSTLEKISYIPKEIDVLQIPLSNLEHFLSLKVSQIEVHSIVRSENGLRSDIRGMLRQLSKVKNVTKAIVGSTNAQHFYGLWGFVENELEKRHK